MKLFITGVTGFVGSHLAKYLLGRGHEVSGTGSRLRQKRIQHPRFSYISADTTRPGRWQEAVAEADAVINLAGKSIFSYWTAAYKKQLYDSRIQTTRNLAQALDPERSVALLSASAVGYYGDCGDMVLTETAPNGEGFLAEVCRDWEASALEAESRGARVAILRFGVVLHGDGGAMQQMIPAFRFGLGGKLGDGRQWFSWIHLADLMAGVDFILENTSMAGPYNFCGDPLRQKEMAKTLAGLLNRPAFMPAPAFLIRTVAGEFGGALLQSQRAKPEKLLADGFKFRYYQMESALKEILDS